jgi:hypothetical protein
LKVITLWRDICKAALLLLLFFQPSLIFGQRHPLSTPIGLRDPIAAGIVIGTAIGIRADVRVIRFVNCALAIEGFFGGGIASWGIGEAWSTAMRLDIHISDDGVSNAFLVSPDLGYGSMIAQPSHGLLNFSPQQDVPSISALCGISWIHEFRSSWSTELSLRPGIALALNGENNNNASAKGELSLQLSLAASIRFE